MTNKEIKQLERIVVKQFNKGCVDFGLLQDGDRILLALSGGKDSLEMVRLMSQRARIHKPSIEVAAAHVVMDNIPYETDRSYLQQFCEDCGVTLHIIHSRFEESTDPRTTHCFLCAWHRRKALFEFAVANGFNKIALGHHMDDILTTLLMNLPFEGSHSTMMPSMPMEHYPLTIIRPMCLVHEARIHEVAEGLNFQKQKTACPYEQASKRATMERMLKELETINPEARYSLWHSVFH